MSDRAVWPRLRPNKNSETRLAERAARLLIDFSPAVHYLAKISGNYAATFVSRRVRAQLGYEPHEFTDQPDFWLNHIHPDDRPRVVENLSRIYESDEVRQEYRFLCSDGSWCWMHDDSVLVRDEDGEPLEIAGAWLDITDLKNSELLLARQKAFSESVIQTAPTIILLLDPKGRILEINSYMEQLSGYSAEEVVGKDWFRTFLPENDRVEIHDLFSEVMASGANSGHTNPIVIKDGTLRQIEWHAKVLSDENGELIALLNIGHDVTERIEYEEALREARQYADAANASKSRFLAAANHDLRQPMHAMRLLLATLTNRANSSSQVEVCQKMQDALDTMAELLDKLLDISELESGSIAPEKRSFSIRELIEHVVSANQEQAKEKGLRLESTRDDCIVFSDPVLLERIVNNFVTNAIRYTERGRVHIGCRCFKDAARIDVTDTGVGIPRNDMGNIFEEYYQLDNPSRDRGKGLGLGLAIVKHIARLLDHRLDVASVPGKGSTFSVEVPLGTLQNEHDEEAPHDSTSTGMENRPCVLLVEDDAAIADATRMLMESAGATVFVAANGPEALKGLETGVRPNIIVSDYRLPGESGIDVVRRVRKFLGKDVPSVLVTGDTSLSDTEFENLTNCRVLHKPIKADRLTALLDRLISRSCV